MDVKNTTKAASFSRIACRNHDDLPICPVGLFTATKCPGRLDSAKKHSSKHFSKRGTLKSHKCTSKWGIQLKYAIVGRTQTLKRLTWSSTQGKVQKYFTAVISPCKHKKRCRKRRPFYISNLYVHYDEEKVPDGCTRLDTQSAVDILKPRSLVEDVFVDDSVESTIKDVEYSAHTPADSSTSHKDVEGLSPKNETVRVPDGFKKTSPIMTLEPLWVSVHDYKTLDLLNLHEVYRSPTETDSVPTWVNGRPTSKDTPETHLHSHNRDCVVERSGST